MIMLEFLDRVEFLQVLIMFAISKRAWDLET